MSLYTTSYCNKAHRVSDGKPVLHECRVIPPEALRAEMQGDIDEAVSIIATAPVKLMRRGCRQ